MKKALITGITGQDGSYLAELLLHKGYEVHGTVRRSSSFNTGRIDHLHSVDSSIENKVLLHYCDLLDGSAVSRLVRDIQPDEIYNLAAQSHVGISFEIPDYTAEATAVGVVRLLEAVRASERDIKIYQASSSELYGKVMETPQTEATPFYPRSPYAVAKLYAFWIIKNYRESYNLFACNGILFNHESERRGQNFVTRKITKSLAEVHLGAREKFFLGNLDAKRDWGHAEDFVEAMWLMLQQDTADDYVVATGETHSVREFVVAAAAELGIDLCWEGKGLEERGVDRRTGKEIVGIDKRLFRPAEVDLLLGDPAKARSALGWTPRVSFDELVRKMVLSDLEMVKSGGGKF